MQSNTLYSSLTVALVLGTIAVIAFYKNKLTAAGAFTGWISSLIIYAAFGITGVIMLAAFFVFGTTTTAIGVKQKHAKGLSGEQPEQRTAGQVLANSGVAAILGVAMLLADQSFLKIFTLMMAAAFSAATADTMSSELGNRFGKNFYNIITFKRDKQGLDGVISLEGTLAGLAGSIVIAVIYCFLTTFNSHLVIVVVAGTIGNLTDSVLGATLERKNVLGNNTVNFINTLTGALVALLFQVL